MAKIEKGTRVRGLPPRVRLSENDNRYGLFPITKKLASDGRTGFDKVQWKDDGILIYRSASVYPGLVQSAEYYSTDSELTTSFPILTYSTASRFDVKRGISDTFLTERNTFLTSSFKPYAEVSFDPAKNSIRGSGSFYETGSSVIAAGPGFTQPLWSKNKIVVDMPMIGPQIMSVSHGTNKLERIMTYYNFQTQTLEGVGALQNINYYASQALDVTDIWKIFARDKAIGFYGSLPTFSSGAFFMKNSGNVYNLNGFPYAQKYRVSPTSSILYPLKNIIDRPFLAEKIAIEFSGSYDPASSCFETTGHANYNATVAHTTFFILNQKPREPVSVPFQFDQLPNTANSSLNPIVLNYPTTGPLTELVTYVQLVAFGRSSGSAFETKLREYTTDRASQTYFSASEIQREATVFGVTPSWSGKFIVSGNVKSPNPANEALPIKFFRDSTGIDTAYLRYLNNDPGGRTGLTDPTYRNWRSPVQSVRQEYAEYEFSAYNPIYITSRSAEDIPYLLLPTDNLIFGWQTAFPNMVYDTPGDSGGGINIDNGWNFLSGTAGSVLTLTGSARLVIYGSYLKVGPNGDLVEDTDDYSLNQLLSSEAIHEIIG